MPKYIYILMISFAFLVVFSGGASADIVFASNQVCKKSLKQLNAHDFSGYVNRPYHDPELVKKERQYQKAYYTKNEQTSSSSISPLVCQNFYAAQRRTGFNSFYVYSSPRKVTSRKVYSYSKFAKACKEYRKKNPLIQSIHD